MTDNDIVDLLRAELSVPGINGGSIKVTATSGVTYSHALRLDAATAIEGLRSELTATQAELAKANEQLGRHRIGTHGPDCWSYGPRHNECLMREFVALRARVVEVGGRLIREVPASCACSACEANRALSNLVKEAGGATDV